MDKGQVYRFVGGWGLLRSDEASAAWLGRTALAETLLAEDGMRPIAGLATSILARFDLALIHISEPTRQADSSYAVCCLIKKNSYASPLLL